VLIVHYTSNSYAVAAAVLLLLVVVLQVLHIRGLAAFIGAEYHTRRHIFNEPLEDVSRMVSSFTKCITYIYYCSI
jgi:hypothetical protein